LQPIRARCLFFCFQLMASSLPIPRRKPPALRAGDVVGIVAPASPLKPDWLEAGCRQIRQLGYEPWFRDSILDRSTYFAGSVERRARELEEMFVHPKVRAVLCARGGYGSNYLLEAIDWTRISAHPKIFVGYSDLTTLLTYFADALGLVCFHGPMVTTDFRAADGVDFASWEAALTGSSEWVVEIAPGGGGRGLIEGSCEGILYGGCLSILVASLGTPFEIQTAGTILFLEDQGAKPYQIDRMLMQLKLAGKLREVAGIVFGEMSGCIQTESQGYTLEEVVERLTADLSVPVAYGLRSGHVSHRNVTLPLGVRARLVVASGEASLRFLESATELQP
jgi:muramoyltetrapeptide carboxypeptidase